MGKKVGPMQTVIASLAPLKKRRQEPVPVTVSVGRRIGSLITAIALATRVGKVLLVISQPALTFVTFVENASLVSVCAKKAGLAIRVIKWNARTCVPVTETVW